MLRSDSCGTKGTIDVESTNEMDGIDGLKEYPTTSISEWAQDTDSRSDAVTGKQLKDLLKKQEFKCAYTGDDLTPDIASLDHRTPLGRGGANHIDNIAIVRHDVNLAKRTMTVDEFVAMCRKVVAHADNA